MDRNCRRLRRDDQPALLVNRLGAAAWLYKINAPHGEGGPYGNLLLSALAVSERGPPAASPPMADWCGAQRAVVDTPQGPLQLVNVHLGLSERERCWQASLLEHAEFLRGGRPADADRRRLQRLGPAQCAGQGRCFLGHGFRQATAPLRRYCTFPAFLLLAAIDKVFYRELEVVEMRVVVAAGRPGGRL